MCWLACQQLASTATYCLCPLPRLPCPCCLPACRRIPLFQVAKLCFVIWLQAPQTQGAQKLYRRHILPLLKQHQARIDKYLEEGRRQLGEQFQWASSTVAAARAGPGAPGEGLTPRSSNATRSE